MEEGLIHTVLISTTLDIGYCTNLSSSPVNPHLPSRQTQEGDVFTFIR